MSDRTIILILASMFVGFILIAIAQPYFESSAYNRLTGASTTYWDAVFLELRVQSEPK